MKMFKKLLALTLALLLCSTAAITVCADGFGDNETPDDWDGIQKVEYTITAEATEGGSVTGGGVVEEGEEVTLTATADEGYEFAGWYLGEELYSTDAEITVIADADKTFTAKFEVEQTEPDEYTISAIAEGFGTVTGGATVEAGQTVTLTATLGRATVKFMGWYLGDELVSADLTYVATADADKTYTAKFVKYNGDVDGNGKITSTDVTYMKRSLKGTLSTTQAAKYDSEVEDVNGKGGLTSTDITFMKRYVKGTLTTDKIAEYNLPPIVE